MKIPVSLKKNIKNLKKKLSQSEKFQINVSDQLTQSDHSFSLESQSLFTNYEIFDEEQQDLCELDYSSSSETEIPDDLSLDQTIIQNTKDEWTVLDNDSSFTNKKFKFKPPKYRNSFNATMSPLEIFSTILPDSIIEDILEYTNTKLQNKKGVNVEKLINMTEIKKYLGLVFLSGINKRPALRHY